MTDLGILKAAEAIPERLLIGQAQSIQVLADKIRQSFKCFRLLLQRYGQNLDALDPQLRNNAELLELCEVYESSWVQGRDQLLDEQKREELICFCLSIEHMSHKYPEFKEQVESCDAEIFLSIPSILILQSLQHCDSGKSHKSLCCRFCDTLEGNLSKMTS